MKYALAVVTVLALAIGSAPAATTYVMDPVPGTGSFDVLPNGGFETGALLPEWLISFTPWGSFSVTSEQAFAGSYSAVTVPNQNFGIGGYMTISQLNIPISSGQTYVFSAFFNTEAASATAHLAVDMDGPIGVGALPQTGWHFAYDTWTASGNELDVRAFLDGTVLSTDRGYVDQIALTPIGEFSPPIPEPATLGLLCLGGIALLRRRKS